MTFVSPSPRRWTRRQALALVLVPVLLAPAAAQERRAILTISRKRLLNETRYAQSLAEAEQRMTAELQGRIDTIKRELAAEEQELARLRSTLPREEFEARTTAFDRTVRRKRREAQQHAATLQQAFRAERVKLLEMLDAFVEAERAERGASIILNRDDAMASDPALDITAALIARFDTIVQPPEIPDLDSLLARTASDDQPEDQ